MDNPDDSPITVLLARFPRELAVVAQHGIDLSAFSSFALVFHCSLLVFKFWTSDGTVDHLFGVACLARVTCAMPRPYFWVQKRRLYADARYQPTPQLVAEKLLDIYEHPYKVEQYLSMFYHSWLFCTTLALCVLGREQQTPATRELWWHCLMNFASIFLQRFLCLGMFYILMQSDMKRGIHPELLDKYSKRFTFWPGEGKACEMGDHTECSICFGSYDRGEEIRKLCCSHCFHKRCIDEWLLKHQNKCPLCLSVVGPS